MARTFDAFAQWQLSRPSFEETGMLDAGAFYKELCKLISLPSELLENSSVLSAIDAHTSQRDLWVRDYDGQSIALERLATKIASHLSEWLAHGSRYTNLRDYCMQHLTMDLDVAFLGALTSPVKDVRKSIWIIGRASQDSGWCICILFDMDPDADATREFCGHPDNNLVAQYISHNAILWSGADREGRNIYMGLSGRPRVVSFVPLSMVPLALVNANLVQTDEERFRRQAIPEFEQEAYS